MIINKATVFISTAALMAGTACGVWAETNDTVSTSFDRAERSVYDSNVNHNPDMVAEVGSQYSANSGFSNPNDAYASPSDAYGETSASTTANTVVNSPIVTGDADNTTEIKTGVAGATGGMNDEAVKGTGATAGTNRSLSNDVGTMSGFNAGASVNSGTDSGM